MNHPDEPGSIFQAPAGPQVEEPPQPTVDGSDEAMRRLRNPFDVQQTETETADRHPGRRTVPTGRGSANRPEPEKPDNTDD